MILKNDFVFLVTMAHSERMFVSFLVGLLLRICWMLPRLWLLP